MLYKDTIDILNNQALNKLDIYRNSPMRYLVASILAGAYIGVGSIILFFMGGPLFAADSPY